MSGIIQIAPIYGLSFGLEYDEREEIGFLINVDLGLLRITWFRDIEPEELD